MKIVCPYCHNLAIKSQFKCPDCRAPYRICGGVNLTLKLRCRAALKPHLMYCSSCCGSSPSLGVSIQQPKGRSCPNPWRKSTCPGCQRDLREVDAMSCFKCGKEMRMCRGINSFLKKPCPVGVPPGQQFCSPCAKQRKLNGATESCNETVKSDQGKSAEKVKCQSTTPDIVSKDSSDCSTQDSSAPRTPCSQSTGADTDPPTPTDPCQMEEDTLPIQPQCAPECETGSTVESMMAMQFSQMNEFRKASHLCDYALQVRNDSFPCHRVVLASAVPFFTRLFANSADVKLYRIKNDHISADVVDQFLSFIYCCDSFLSLTNLAEFMLLAEELQTENLKKHCERFLEHCPITHATCLQLYAVYSKLKLSVPRECIEVIPRHFTELSESSSFLSLTVEHLCLLLQDDAIQCRSESDILRSVLRWLDHDSERMPFASDVLRYVRLGLLTVEELGQLTHSFFQSSEGRLLLDRVIEFIKYPELRWQMYSSMVRPRIDSEWMETVVTPMLSKNCLCYCILIADWKDNQRSLVWKKVATRLKVHVPPDQLKVVCSGSAVYMYGSSLHDFFIMPNVIGEGMQIVAGSPEPVASAACVASVGSIYLIGGVTRTTVGIHRTSSAVQRLELSTTTWHRMPDLPVAVLKAHAFRVGNKIYVCGGIGADGRILRTIQILDLKNLVWTHAELFWPEPFDGRLDTTCIDGTLYMVTSQYIAVLDMASLKVTPLKIFPQSISRVICCNGSLSSSAFLGQIAVMSGFMLWLFDPKAGSLHSCSVPKHDHLFSMAAMLMKKKDFIKRASVMTLSVDQPESVT